MASGKFICLVCGKTEAHPKGSVTLCVRWITRRPHPPCGVCEDCLKAHTMDEIAVAPEFAKLLTPQPSAEATLMWTAIAKSKADSDFCLDDYLDEAGLRDVYENALE